MVQFAAWFEALCISSVSGLVSNYKESFLTLKKETAALILLKLAAQTPMLKMFYANFDDQITVKHGIVVINWPLKNFQSPSNVGSMTKLKVLYNAWKTGMATFCKLTCLEWEEWDNACFKACIAESQSANGEIGPELQYCTSNDHSGSQAITNIRTVSGVDGQGVTVTKKPRKMQSNKGKKCGPQHAQRSLPASAIFAPGASLPSIHHYLSDLGQDCILSCTAFLP
ncbi:hypothetical protein J3A83DRAFT_4193259 [Scleroderma citrinum]